MSSIKKALRSYLVGDSNITALFGTRVFPQFTATSTTLPYLTYERSSSQNVVSMTNVSDLRNETYTFIVYDETQLGVETATRALQVSLDAINRQLSETYTLIRAFEQSENDDLDARGVADEIPAYSEIVTYTIWYREP